MSKLYLHAGTHKTGTTAIQTFAAKHRSELLNRGLLYPDLSPIRETDSILQHPFAHAIAEISSPINRKDAMKLPVHWAEAAAKHSANVLLSIEPIYRHVLRLHGKRTWLDGRKNYLERLATALDPFEVEVVLVFRRPDDFVRSLFQESVMKATQPRNWQNFAQFRKGMVKTMLRYYTNAELFREFFGVVKVMTFNDLVGEGKIAHSFFKKIDVNVMDLEDVGVVRKSLTPQETMLKLFLNLCSFDPALNDRVVSWIKSPEVSELLDCYFGSGPFDIWESEAARKDFLEQVSKEMELLHTEFFVGKETLFPSNFETRKYPSVPPVPDELKAAIAQQVIFREPKNEMSQAD